MKADIPLSPYAAELRKSWPVSAILFTVATSFLLFISLLSLSFGDMEILMVCLTFEAIIALLCLPFIIPQVRGNMIDAKRFNEEDWNRAQLLSTQLRELAERSFSAFNQDDVIHPDSRFVPYRIEHYPSQSVRATFETSRVTLPDILLWGRDKKTDTENARGISVPNLMDMCSVIFTRDPDTGETLRVLIPSLDATKEFFLKILDKFKGVEKKRRHSELRNWNSHTSAVLNSFSLDLDMIERTLSHAQIIDGMDAKIHAGVIPEQLKVRGSLVAPGVAVATTLEFANSGELYQFFPAGFLQEVNETLGIFLEELSAPLQLEEAVGAE